MIAEPAIALGGLAVGTARMAAAASTLDEYLLGTVAGLETVGAIAERLAAYGASVRKAIDDELELNDQTLPISSSATLVENSMFSLITRSSIDRVSVMTPFSWRTLGSRTCLRL
jgi:DNA-binding ferritin-like protein